MPGSARYRHAQLRHDLGDGVTVLPRPRHVELAAVDLLGDLAGEDEVGFGVRGGQVQLGHGSSLETVLWSG